MATQDFYTWACVLAMCPAFAAVLLFFLARIILIASVSGTSCILAMQESLIGVLGQGKHLLAMPRSRFGCSAQSFILWESAENVNAWIAKLFLILTFPAQEIYMFDLLLDLAQRATLACGAGASCNWLGWTIKPYSCEEFQKLSLFRLHWEPHRFAAIFSD